jgi:hypothetical protein
MRCRTARWWILAGLAVSAAAVNCEAAEGTRLTCQPVAQRMQDMGCWILASEQLGPMSSGPLYWHLYAYPTRAAAESAKMQKQTVVESLGRVWLMSMRRRIGGPRAENVSRSLDRSTRIQLAAIRRNTWKRFFHPDSIHRFIAIQGPRRGTRRAAKFASRRLKERV